MTDIVQNIPVLKLGIIVGLSFWEVISKFSLSYVGGCVRRTETVGLTARMKLMAIVIKVDERRSTLNSWIFTDEHSRQLHVQLPMQNFHLKYS